MKAFLLAAVLLTLTGAVTAGREGQDREVGKWVRFHTQGGTR